MLTLVHIFERTLLGTHSQNLDVTEQGTWVATRISCHSQTCQFAVSSVVKILVFVNDMTSSRFEPSIGNKCTIVVLDVPPHYSCSVCVGKDKSCHMCVCPRVLPSPFLSKTSSFLRAPAVAKTRLATQHMPVNPSAYCTAPQPANSLEFSSQLRCSRNED